ncbi:hypothetical protein [Paracoccus ravus]|uniref:hypothetical protein n=1 Tax=Paracoccus ravus TaxID=2447760 RepID=UPI00106EC50F|nr:hypothetical protein [Paracoccus ravus]
MKECLQHIQNLATAKLGKAPYLPPNLMLFLNTGWHAGCHMMAYGDELGIEVHPDIIFDCQKPIRCPPRIEAITNIHEQRHLLPSINLDGLTGDRKINPSRVKVEKHKVDVEKYSS